MDEETLRRAWDVFTSGVPREDLNPEARAAADAAIEARVARWAPVTALGADRPYWRLRWNLPQPKPKEG